MSSTPANQRQIILAELAWSYVVFSLEDEYILTALLGGVAEIALSIRLTLDEVEQIRDNPAYASDLLNKIKSERGKFVAREIHPAIWPQQG